MDTTKVYLDFSKLLALIGEEYMSQIDRPSSPIIIVPRDVDISAPGNRSNQTEKKDENDA
jgi:hypothetical protein